MIIQTPSCFLSKQNLLVIFLLTFNVTACSFIKPTSNLSTQTTSVISISSSEVAIALKGVGSPTVVFESGLGVDKNTWNDVFKEIAKSNQVFAYDRAGLGESSLSWNSRDACTIARELNEVLKASNTKPPYVLVGHSIGGLYQYVFSTLYPEDVVGLVLIDSHFPPEWYSKPKPKRPKNLPLKKKEKNVFQKLHYTFSLKLSSSGRELKDKGLCLENVDRKKPVFFPVESLVATNKTKLKEKKLAWYNKTLDWYHNEWFNLLGNKVPRVQVRSGHYIHKEKPDIVIEKIKKLLKKIDHFDKKPHVTN